MKRLIFLGVCLIVVVELLALILHDRRFVLAASGTALALVLLNVRRFVGRPEPAEEPEPDDLVVGLHPSGLGSPPASDARAAIRNDNGPKAIQRPTGVSSKRPNALRRRNMGMGQSEQRDAHR